MKQSYYILAVFSIALCIHPLGCEENVSAVLAEGTTVRSGIPGFGPNAIQGLYGKYSLDSVPFAEVWAVSEPLLFGEERWKQDRIGEFKAYYNGTERNRIIWAVGRTIVVRENSDIPSRWVLIVCFNNVIDAGAGRKFTEEVVRRTETFFASARRLSDLSFPATVKVTGKAK